MVRVWAKFRPASQFERLSGLRACNPIVFLDENTRSWCWEPSASCQYSTIKGRHLDCVPYNRTNVCAVRPSLVVGLPDIQTVINRQCRVTLKIFTRTMLFWSLTNLSSLTHKHRNDAQKQATEASPCLQNNPSFNPGRLHRERDRRDGASRGEFCKRCCRDCRHCLGKPGGEHHITCSDMNFWGHSFNNSKTTKRIWKTSLARL